MNADQNSKNFTHDSRKLPQRAQRDKEKNQGLPLMTLITRKRIFGLVYKQAPLSDAYFRLFTIGALSDVYKICY